MFLNLDSFQYKMYLNKVCARSPVDKASASEAEDRWFDSSRAYHFIVNPPNYNQNGNKLSFSI